MTKRIWLLLALVLSCGLIAAGCGDDDDSGGGSSDEPAQEKSGGSGSGGTGGSGSEDVPENQDEAIEQAKEQCKQGIGTNAPQASEDLKNRLEEVCDKIESAEDVAEALRGVCKVAVEESVPAGSPAREQALQACEQIVAEQQ